MEEREINKVIAGNLLKLRKAKKLTQLELAEKFNYSDKTISKWENGESLPGIDVLSELAKFYGTTLDALTNSEVQSSSKPTKTTIRRERMFPVRPVITLMSICAIWICATAIFSITQITQGVSYPIIFLWAVPASSLLLVIFTSIWSKKKRYLFISISALVWTSILCIHLQFLAYNLWPLYLVGIPIQIAIVLSGALVKKKNPKQTTNLNEENK